MGMFQINDSGPVINWLVELNHLIRDEHKESRGVFMGEGQGQGLLEEDESQLNEDLEGVSDGWEDEVHAEANALAFLQRRQQQSQLSLACWERFLPVRSLKVLLVENDGSTRRVIFALLRNCGYEVVAVENGLQAWNILEDLTNQINLVLTEVVMPCLSGIELLHKIMSHKTCKNIPVIMMSSNDSVSIVVKCLSKGAVYFLSKPIRKNELQNLWRHVRRQWHSSSCSGSESGVITQKSANSTSAEELGNSGSNDEDDIGTIGLNIQDGIDYESGKQSSLTKRATEVDSRKPLSPFDQLGDPPDSTCAQDPLSRPEAFDDSWLPLTTTRESKGQDDELDNVVMAKDLDIGVPRITNLQLEDPNEKVLSDISSIDKERVSELDSENDDEQLELSIMKSNGNSRNQAADIITQCPNYPIEKAVLHIPNGLFPGTKEKTIYYKKEIPSLDLGLKRQRDVGNTETSLHERNVLRHSDKHSAFSRYSSASTANQVHTGNVGSCSPLDIGSEAEKTETVQNFQSNSNSTPPQQCSNSSSNNVNMGLTTNGAVTKKMAFSGKPTAKSIVKCLHKSSACQPVRNSHNSSPQPTIQGKVDDAVANTSLDQERGMKQQVQVQHQHHYYHYHHHHHHVHSMPQQQLTNNDDFLENKAATAPHFGSSNMLSPSIKGNAGNRSLNGSNSGSKHGSHGQNGSNNAVNAVGTNTESDNDVAVKCGVAGSISGSGVDTNHFAQREAALNKFRQKRRERCFEKKVQYQSRKKLAEQRPRVRGHFVPQVVLENKDKDADG